MSLSTSSSDAPVSQRRVYLKILLAILLGMLVSLALVRAFTYSAGASGAIFLARVVEARAALPRITSEPDDLVMVFGSSMVEAGFSPREFDQALAQRGVPVKSFNFGFGGLNPLFQDYLSRRIVDQFNADGRRLKLVVIEFNPFQTTIARRKGALEAEDSLLPMLASPAEMWQMTLDDPTRGVRMYVNRYLRDGVSAEMVTTHFGESFVQPPRATQLKEDETQAERLDEVLEAMSARFKEDYPDYVDSQWSYEWQGGGTIMSERPQETLDLVYEYYSLIATDYRMDQDRFWRIQSADIIDLNFDPVLVDSFIRIVQNFQTISSQVEVVLLPKNDDWIANPPAALARLDAAIARIERETGVSVRNYQKIEAVSNDMFSDTTHLNRYTGAVAFTEFLAEQFAKDLGATP